MTGRQLFVIIAALMLNGCFANSRSIYRLYHIDSSDPTKTTVIDAKQRAIISVSAPDKDNEQDEEEKENEQSRSVFVCAEPSPDALTAISVNLSGKIGNNEVDTALKEAIKELGTRNATIQLLRDGLYRQCEAYMNGVIDGKKYERIANKYVNAMVVLLAIEKISANKDTVTDADVPDPPGEEGNSTPATGGETETSAPEPGTDDVAEPDEGADNEGKPKTGNIPNKPSDKKKKFSEDGIESQDGDMKPPLAIAIITKAFLEKDTVDYCFYNLSGEMQNGENKMSPEFTRMCADLVREYAKRIEVEENPDSLKDECDRTPLHFAARNDYDPEVIRKLIEGGADVNAKDCNGGTPLHYAARYNSSPEIIKLLIDKKANVNAENNNKETPLHYAGLNSNPEVVRVLIEEGADINAKDGQNATPLHYAVRSTNPGATKLLLAGGADKDAIGHYGRTPLHYAIVDAVRKTNPEVIRLLIKACADVNIRDKGRNTPLDVCCKKMSGADAAEVKKWLRDPRFLTQGRCP